MKPAIAVLCASARHPVPGVVDAALARREILGSSLIGHSIDYAKSCRTVRGVVVITDDAGVGDVARRCGAEVLPWPTSEDERPHKAEWDVVSRTLEPILRAGGAPEASVIALLSPRTPVRGAGELDKAVELVAAGECDACVQLALSHGVRPWRCVDENPVDGGAVQSQDDRGGGGAHETGSFLCATPRSIRSGWRRSRVAGVFVNRLRTRPMLLEATEDLERILCDHHREILRPVAAAVRLLVLDFDGVMTDNKVYVREDGVETVACNRSDGLGIGLAKAAGLPILVLSKEENPVVSARCRKLKLECLQGIDDKLGTLKKILTERGIDPRHVAYVGNDVNDLPCLQFVGLPIGVADSLPAVRAKVQLLTTNVGGNGAVREVIDWILDARAEHSA